MLFFVFRIQKHSFVIYYQNINSKMHLFFDLPQNWDLPLKISFFQ